ncbi:MAG: hypothetical protein K6E49_05735 [Lachnospiraceae bacterium]|nr:hypothetical protein [Lachnospiraceae bacterium]
MKYLKKHSKAVSTLIGLGIFVLSVAAVLFYLYKRCRSEYNGDFTDTILWANAAVKSGHFYSPDYWYAYFLPFSGIPLMIPIVKAFGLTYFSHQLGLTVFSLIFAAALFAFMKAMGNTTGEAFALSGLTMIFMCASSITRMIFYGHVIHYSLAVLFMCVAFCLLKRSSVFDPQGKRALVFDILIAVWCLLCATNGLATVIIFFMPFTLSLVLERYLDSRPITYDTDKGLIKTVTIYAAGALCGFAVKSILFPTREYEHTITALLPSDGWVWKQSPFLLEWIKVLTDDSPKDVMMMTFDGIRILILYTFAVLLLIIPVFAAISYKKIADRMLRLLILFYWLMFAMTMLTYSVSYALVSNWRLAGLVCCSAILSLQYSLYMIKNRQNMRWFVLLVPVYAAVALICLLSVKSIPSALNANRNDKLIEIYRENGLTRGYSSFWNSANAVTVLSDNEINVSPILFWPDGRYGVRHYQSDPSDYEDVPGVSRYFVAVDAEERAYCADTLVANCVEEIKYDDDLYILVFDRNVFSGLEPVYSDPYPYE